MKRSTVALCVLCCLLTNFVWQTPGSAADGAPDGAMDVTPLTGIDENLFLVRALEETYVKWPRNTTDQATLQAFLGQTRERVSRLKATIETRKLDAGVLGIYDDCLHMLDVYETYLANLGAIDRDAVRRAKDDSDRSAQVAFEKAGDAASKAKANGETTGDAVGKGALVGILEGALDDYQRKQAREADKQNALDAEARSVSRAWTDTRARAEVMTEQLTKSHGWAQGEAGFDGFVAEKLNEYVKRRPHDPFALVAYAVAKDENDTVALATRDVSRCVTAAKLVPAGRAYDCYRIDFLAGAASRAVDAAVLDLPKPSYSSGPSKSAPEAIRVCQTLLAIDPDDSSAVGNMLLERAYACAGQYDEAIKAGNAAMKLWRQDAAFAYRYARLLSLTDQPKLAADWLKESYRLGGNFVAVARTDSDFEGLRKKEPARFTELTTPKLGWRIDYGIVLDDVIVENQSAFAITNVKVSLVIKKGDRTWTPVLAVGELGPGQVYKFADVFTIPEDKYDSAAVTFTTDQDPK